MSISRQFDAWLAERGIVADDTVVPEHPCAQFTGRVAPAEAAEAARRLAAAAETARRLLDEPVAGRGRPPRT
ncbi:hypothetical protein CSPHI_03035 [Corynebacterium sphenisci DSM 44792]|uniref:Uncharacterized protein n=1 Tax=Corynebacterium sphenisci DSM 44792 TaxID=1437874 RepID=A0A1L7CWJ8_9CORY|nr:hypothetical protein [Corynebacterium sphenisci]APT90214.1 hypothetical protein CSPHI_03035 [Corynebacterium sphenisci DSM 44792]